MSTSCGHNFCRPCLLAKFGAAGEVRDRGGGRRELRRVKVAKPCPAPRCCADIGDLLLNPQVLVTAPSSGIRVGGVETHTFYVFVFVFDSCVHQAIKPQKS